MKVSAVLRALAPAGVRQALVDTGQHYDSNVFNELDNPKSDFTAIIAPFTSFGSEAERLVALLAEQRVSADAWTEADWDRLIAVAQRHNLAPVLYARLKERGLTPPSAAAERLRGMYLASAARNIRLFQDLGAILRALHAVDIPVIVLKGACLAESVYGNIALRPMEDVDLLVKHDHTARALGVLQAIGYASRHPFDPVVEQAALRHMPPLYKAGGPMLELHWTIAASFYHARFTRNDLEQLWARATPATIGGESVLVLEPTDLLLHLCLHASILHRFDGPGLRTFVDLARVIRQYRDTIDWEQFTARANRWGAANGVRLALQLAKEWSGAAVPASALQALQATSLDDATMNWVRHKVLNGVAPALTQRVASLEGAPRWADKLRVLRDVLFPPRVEMARVYHLPAESWRILACYPVRFKDLWVRYGRAMWQVVRRDETFTTEARQEARLREYLGWL